MSPPYTEVEVAAGFVLASMHELGRATLVQLAQSAIDRLDELDGDCDLEDGNDSEDLREDFEYDYRDQPALVYGPDQTDRGSPPDWLGRRRIEMFGPGPIRG